MTTMIFSTGKIKPNGQYKLIYRYNGDPSLSVEMTFAGHEVYEGLLNVQRLICDNQMTFDQVRNDILVQYLEVWGLSETGQNIRADKYDSQCMERVAAALKSDAKFEYVDNLRALICAYFAIHINYLTESNTMIVKDMQPDQEIMEGIVNMPRKDFNTWPRSKPLSYEDSIESFENKGALVIEYPRGQQP